MLVYKKRIRLIFHRNLILKIIFQVKLIENVNNMSQNQLKLSECLLLLLINYWIEYILKKVNMKRLNYIWMMRLIKLIVLNYCLKRFLLRLKRMLRLN